MKNKSVLNFFWLGSGGLFFCLLCLGQLQRIQLTSHIAVYGHDFVALSGVMVWGLSQFKSGTFARLNLLNLLRQWWPETLLIAWIILGLGLAMWQQRSGLTGVLYLGRLGVYSLFTWALLRADAWKQLPEQIAGLSIKLWAYFATGLMILFFGLLQYLLLPDTRFLGLLGYDNHYYRLLSTQLDPAFAGMLLVMTLLLSFELKIRAHWRWSLQLLLTIAVALTFSRASYLALIAGVLAYGALGLMRQRQWRPEVLLIAALLISLPFLPRKGGEGVNLTRTSTITARVTATSDNVSSVSPTQWLIGRGLFVPDKIESQNVRRPDRATLPDNIVVLIVTQLGVIGTLMLGWLLGRRWRWWWQQPPLSLSCLVAVLLHAQFNQTLFQPFVFLLWWGILLAGRPSITAKPPRA